MWINNQSNRKKYNGNIIYLNYKVAKWISNKSKTNTCNTCRAIYVWVSFTQHLLKRSKRKTAATLNKLWLVLYNINFLDVRYHNGMILLTNLIHRRRKRREGPFFFFLLVKIFFFRSLAPPPSAPLPIQLSICFRCLCYLCNWNACTW